MKLHPLFIALALATGAAYAQAPAGSDQAPQAPAATSSKAADEAPAPAQKKSHKKHATAKHHASAKKHEQHMASSHHHGTHAMGAGAATPVTDLNASSREHRMDQAYADWQARQR